MRALARINVTPVKGTALVHPEAATVSLTGIAENRRFYLVDERGALFSGSTFGQLVRIRSSYDPEDERLGLLFPDGTEVAGPADALGSSEVTDYYGRPVPSRMVEGLFGDALSAYCGRPVRLLRCDRDGDGADVEPLTIVSLASVDDLSTRGGRTDELDPRRFRITLELDGCAAYEEDTWHGRRVRVGDVTIRVDGQVPRCVVTTQDPDSGMKDWNTLTQIARLRPRIPGGGLPFGMYARVDTPGSVRIGDPIDLDS
ncbi:MAG: MOSC domain-containing protein [Actinomycetota bacterium]